MIILDTGSLLAAVNPQDGRHLEYANLFQEYPHQLIVPSPVFAEACYRTHIEGKKSQGSGNDAEMAFIERFASGNFQLVELTGSDMTRIAEILQTYNSVPLSVADTSVVAVAERLGSVNVASSSDPSKDRLMQIRPTHARYLHLLPAYEEPVQEEAGLNEGERISKFAPNAVVVDTGPLLAVANSQDRHHAKCVNFFEATHAPLVVPSPVFNEACHLIGKKCGSRAVAAFIQRFGDDFEIGDLTHTDLARMTTVLGKYPDFSLGAADASVIAVAEGRNAVSIATLDERHFSEIQRTYPYNFNLPLAKKELTIQGKGSRVPQAALGFVGARSSGTASRPPIVHKIHTSPIARG